MNSGSRQTVQARSYKTSALVFGIREQMENEMVHVGWLKKHGKEGEASARRTSTRKAPTSRISDPSGVMRLTENSSACFGRLKCRHPLGDIMHPNVGRTSSQETFWQIERTQHGRQDTQPVCLLLFSLRGLVLLCWSPCQKAQSKDLLVEVNVSINRLGPLSVAKKRFLNFTGSTKYHRQHLSHKLSITKDIYPPIWFALLRHIRHTIISPELFRDTQSKSGAFTHSQRCTRDTFSYGRCMACLAAGGRTSAHGDVRQVLK